MKIWTGKACWRVVLAWVLCASSSLLCAGTSQTYFALVFSSPKPGMEAEFNRWYNDEHAPDVVSIPGFVSAQRFIRSPLQLRPKADDSPAYLVLYKIVTDDLDAVYAEVNRRAANGRTRMSQSIALHSGLNVTYLVTDSVVALAGGRDMSVDSAPAPSYYHIVLSDSKAGEENTLDRWYSQSHGPDMMKLPDFVGYTLGVRAAVQMTPDSSAPRHFALFHIETDDFPALQAAFAREVPHMTAGPPMINLWGYTYQPIGPELSGQRIRAERIAGHSK